MYQMETKQLQNRGNQMTNEFAGNVKKPYKPLNHPYPDLNHPYSSLPKEEPRVEDIDEWKKEANMRLKELGTGEQVRSNFWHGFLVTFFLLSVIIMLIMAGLVVGYVKDNRFKTTVDQRINSYFNQTTYNNFTIVNNLDNDVNNNIQLNATIIMNVDNLNIFTNST